MDYLKKTKRQYFISLFLSVLVTNLIIIASWITLRSAIKLTNIDYAIILGAIALIISLLISLMLAKQLISPLKYIRNIILNISAPNQNFPQENIDKLNYGRQLIANLANQIYQLASPSAKAANSNPNENHYVEFSKNFVESNLPLPLFVLDNEENIVFANNMASQYIGLSNTDLVGKNFYMIMDMSFPSENTLDKWLEDVKAHNATATTSWERVKLNVIDNHPTLLFDLAAYYNKDNPNKEETILVIFDHTKQYSQDEQSISFLALSVHELRTPLTLLRGYIEALQDEMLNSNNSTITEYMQKMSATAQQLNAFVNNILNVARVDNDQLQLQFHEENWSDILTSAVESIRLRATIRNIQIETTIAPDLPTVGVDRLSIYEVISNLIDNAIKYSDKSQLIKINSYLNQAGLVETTVQDFGLGINASIMANLFTKFYRDHRNRSQVGGTGLGLYLSKAIVTAHGGNIWVNSTPNKGSTFSFTIKPYSLLAPDIKNNNNKDIVVEAHGWIKNHSLYRR